MPDQPSPEFPPTVPRSSSKKRRVFLRNVFRGVFLGGLLFGGHQYLQNRRSSGEGGSADFKRAKPKRKPAPLILPDEKDYAAFLATLKLRYIAPHEVISAHRRERNGVQNTLPPRHLWQQMVPTLRVADELRSRLGVKLLYIASAYRSPNYNRQCPGAASNSYHIKNRALDLIYDCSTSHAMSVAKSLRDEGYFKGGLGKYSSFIHIDTRGYNATWDRA